MAAFAAVFQSVQSFLAPPAPPKRLLAVRRVRLFAAAGAGSAGGVVLLAVYYATLGLLPSAFAYPTTEYPVSAWAHRLDLAQFAGTLLYPPLPSPLTWWLGLAVLFGTSAAFGVIYAVLLTWALQPSDAKKGTGFGMALFLGLALTLSVANGVHPAIMRNALPDTGVFLIGWSSLATLQLLLVHLLYGATVGALYQRWTLRG
jgi:hypothetical protein